MAARTVTNPMSLLGLNADELTAVKGFEKIVLKNADSIPDTLGQFFKEATFDAKKITTPVYSGFPIASEFDLKSEMDEVTSAYMWDIVVQQYAMGAKYSTTLEQQMYDDLYKMNPKYAKDFGVSLAHSKQLTGASYWANAFTASSVCQWYGVEGAAFFSASHTYAPQAAGTNGGVYASTWSNLGAGPVSTTNLLDACNRLIGQRDLLGRPLYQKPRKLFVSEQKVANALEALNVGMTGKGQEMSNTRNPFAGNFAGIEVVPYPYFPDIDMWILMGDKAETYMSIKQDITIRTDRIPGSAQQLETYGFFTYAFWAESPVGFIGYAG